MIGQRVLVRRLLAEIAADHVLEAVAEEEEAVAARQRLDLGGASPEPALDARAS